MSRRTNRGAILLKAGGTLAPEHVYIKRPADTQLLEHLRHHEYCYVLATRQIGKSSLRSQVQKLLHQLGYRCASISLDQIGTEISTEQFCCSFLDEVCGALHMTVNVAARWQQYPAHYTTVQRFVDFFAKELAAEVTQKQQDIIIFIDEIDTLLSTKINRGDFFGALRALYNLRAENQGLKRISFCLLGVASPGELISDAARTPFNVGRSISMSDFSRSELEGFRKSLTRLKQKPEQLLDQIYYWTGGHPYMTQRICVALQEKRASRQVPDVDQVVKELFLSDGRYREQNLQYAEKRIDSHADPFSLLSLYQRLLSEDAVAAKAGDLIQIELVLSGLAREEMLPDGKRVLCRRNLVYARVFDKAWVEEKTTQRTFYQRYLRWQEQGRSRSFLLSGSELQGFKLWAKEHAHDITPQEREFLEACSNAESDVQVVSAKIEQAEATAKYEAERRQRAEEHSKRSHLTILGLAGALILLCCFAIFYYLQSQSVTEAHNKKQLALLAVDARRQGDLVLRGGRTGATALTEIMFGILQHSKSEGSGGNDQQLERFAGSNAEEWRGLVTIAQRAQTQSYLTTSDQGTISDAAILSGPTLIPSERQQRTGAFVISSVGDDASELQGWDLLAGKAPWAPPSSKSILQILPYANDEFFATRGHDTVDLWHIATPKEKPIRVSSLGQHMGEVSAFDISQDHSYLATADASTIRIFKIPGTTPERSFPVPKLIIENQEIPAVIEAIAIAPGNKEFAIILRNRHWESWNIEAEKPRITKGSTPDNQTHFVAVSYRPDHAEGKLSILDNHGKLLNFPERSHTKQRRTFGDIYAATFSLDGKLLATVDLSGIAHVWDLKTERLVGDYKVDDSSFKSVTFSGDGKYLLAVGQRGDSWGTKTKGDWFAQAWKLDFLKNQLRSPFPAPHLSTFPNSEHIVLLKNHMDVEVWNWDAQKLVSTWRLKDEGAISSFEVSADMQYFIFQKTNGSIRIYDTALAQKTMNPFPDARVLSAKLLPPSACPSTLCTVVTFADSSVQNFTLKQDAWTAGPRLKDVFGLKAVPLNEEMMAMIHVDGQVSIYELRTGNFTRRLKLAQKHQGATMQLAFSPDASRLAIASHTNDIEIIDPTTNKLLGRLPNLDARQVTSMAFSPSGDNLVTAYSTGEVDLWDVRARELLLPLFQHDKRVDSVAYSPDGKRILSSGQDGSTIIHLATREDYFQAGCHLLHQFARQAQAFASDKYKLVSAACSSTYLP